MTNYIDKKTLRRACEILPGTCGTFMFCWFALKAKGLDDSHSVVIDTKNTTLELRRLWSYGEPSGKLFFPMSVNERFRTYNSDASRSVVQTNIKQWRDHTGTVDPSRWLDISQNQNKSYTVSLNDDFCNFLGHGKQGFALKDDERASIPILAFAIWYGKQTPIPENERPEQYLINDMLKNLHISSLERQCIFIDTPKVDISCQNNRLSDGEIYALLQNEVETNRVITGEKPETLLEHIGRIKTMQNSNSEYAWLNYDPYTEFQNSLDSGEKAIVLMGAPRTGKSHAVHRYIKSNALQPDDITIIQMHDSWTYEHLMLGQTIKEDGSVDWVEGPLLEAIHSHVKFIVLEEANRTRLSEALGELFQTLEPAYRNIPITLANGEELRVPDDTSFIFTMNNVDKSTEDVDDAFLGRCTVIDFYPRVERLFEILDSKSIDSDLSTAIRQFFKLVNEKYPLGQGYFAALPDNANSNQTTDYYLTRIRPVLKAHFSSQPEVLSQLDKSFDDIIVKPFAGDLDA